MKKLICAMLIVLSVSLSTANTSNAYKNYGTELLVLEDSVDTFIEITSLRHLCMTE